MYNLTHTRKDGLGLIICSKQRLNVEGFCLEKKNCAGYMKEGCLDKQYVYLKIEANYCRDIK